MLGRGRRAWPRRGPAGAFRGVKKRESRRSWENRIRNRSGAQVRARWLSGSGTRKASQPARWKPIATVVARLRTPQKRCRLPRFCGVVPEDGGRGAVDVGSSFFGRGLRRPASPQKFRSGAVSAAAPRLSGRKSGRQMGSFATNREKNRFVCRAPLHSSKKAHTITETSTRGAGAFLHGSCPHQPRRGRLACFDAVLFFPLPALMLLSHRRKRSAKHSSIKAA